MRLHTDNHTAAHATTPAHDEACVNEVRAATSAVKLSIKPDAAERPHLLVRRDARWARRANH